MIRLNWKCSIQMYLLAIFTLWINSGAAQVIDTIEISVQENIYIRSNPVLIYRKDSGMIKVNSIYSGRDSLYKNYFFIVYKDTNKINNIDSIYSIESDKNWLILQKLFRKKYFSFVGLQFICVKNSNAKLYIKKRNVISLNNKIKLCFRCSPYCMFSTRKRP